ncbi:hypothetical protein [Pseudozobellia thermophila]|uniref:EF-hand domain-containing protein n=1 Tax=Pseudozobellia thermophila TaxID=192903 RepID=A0A1M6C587_9FLAO|nr:hypothetical protein [Pseudozobellia thermophila]SHI56179.1 hypothetical protein SAMN04488513_101646 [Pseudozobellia thermophila]
MKTLSKSLIFFVALIFMLFLASCGKDDGPEIEKEEVAEQPKEKDDGQEEESEQEEEEEVTAEESNMILDNVVIKGGTRIEGGMPAPNETINFEAQTTGGSAFVEEGFNVVLTSDIAFVGAYIQFKADGALVSDAYFDVDLTENGSFEAASKAKDPRAKGRSKGAKGHYYDLNIGFTSQIAAESEFCYLVAVYDDQGNISGPKEVCLKVKDWGGYEELVGEWHFSKYETYFLDGHIESEWVGVEQCHEATFTCENAGTFDYRNCFSVTYRIFDLRADGTFTHTYKDADIAMDYEPSQQNCSPVYKDWSLEYVIEGKWSFNPETKDIIFVEYEQQYVDASGTYDYSFPLGQGQVYPYGPISVNLDQLTVGYGAENLGKDLNGDGVVNNDDSGFLGVFEKQ